MAALTLLFFHHGGRGLGWGLMWLVYRLVNLVRYHDGWALLLVAFSVFLLVTRRRRRYR